MTADSATTTDVAAGSQGPQSGAARERDYKAKVLAKSPRAYWRQGESSGLTMVDSSGNARNGTWNLVPVRNEPSLTTDTGDPAVTVDGTQVATIPYATWMNSASYSIEFWLKSTQAGQRYTMSRYSGSSSTSQFYIYGIDGLTANFYFTNNGVSGVAYNPYLSGVYTPLNDGKPHHIVITATTSSQKLYVDGVLNSTSNPYPGVALRQPTATAMVICNLDAQTTNRYVGSIDEVAFYGVVLTAAEVLENYNEGSPPTKDVAVGGASNVPRSLVDDATTIDYASSPQLSFATDTAPATDAAAGASIANSDDVWDDFGRPDDPLSLGVAPTGQTWLVPSTAVWGIASNTAESQSVTNYQGAAYIDMGTPDVQIIATWTNYEFYAGFVLRFQDENNYLFMYFDGVELYEYVDNDYNSLGGSGGFHTEGDRYEIRAVGTTIQAFQNDALVMEWKDVTTFSTETKHGMYSEGTGDRLDDLIMNGDPSLASLPADYDNRKLLVGSSGYEIAPPYQSSGEFYLHPGANFSSGGYEYGEPEILQVGFNGPTFWYEWVCPSGFPDGYIMVFHSLYVDYPDMYDTEISIYTGEPDAEVEIAIPLSSVTITPGGNVYDITSVGGASALTTNDGDTSYLDIPTLPSTSFAPSYANGLFDGSALPADGIITRVKLRYTYKSANPIEYGGFTIGVSDNPVFTSGHNTSSSVAELRPDYVTFATYVQQPGVEWITMDALRAGDIRGRLTNYVNNFVKTMRVTAVELVVSYRAPAGLDTLVPVATGIYNIYHDHDDYNEEAYVPFKPVPGESYKIQIRGDNFFTEERSRFEWFPVPHNTYDDPTTPIVLPSEISGFSNMTTTRGSTLPYGFEPLIPGDGEDMYENINGSIWFSWTAPLDWDTSKYGHFRVLSAENPDFDTRWSISIFTGTDYDDLVAAGGAHAGFPGGGQAPGEQERVPADSSGFGVVPGETYLIWVASYWNIPDFYLEWDDTGVLVPPYYDNYTYDLGYYIGSSLYNLDQVYTLRNSTLQENEPVHAGTTRSIWLGFSSDSGLSGIPLGTIYRLDVHDTTATDIWIMLYRIPASIAHPGIASLGPYLIAEGFPYVDFPLDDDFVYFVQISDTQSQAINTNFKFSWAPAAGITPPSNDNHDGAIELLHEANDSPVFMPTMVGTLLGATLEAGYTNTVPIDQDVWYLWTSPITGTVTWKLNSGVVYPSAFLTDGTHVNTKPTYWYQSDDWVWDAVAGTTYLIRIGGAPFAGSENSSFSFKYPNPTTPMFGLWKLWDYVNGLWHRMECGD